MFNLFNNPKTMQLLQMLSNSNNPIAQMDNIFGNDPKYQAFNRFINRESHSLGQNIYDFKDFDYDIFFEAFKLVFTSNNYEEHFNKMMSL